MRIDFGRTPEESMAVIKTHLQQLHGDAYGNGQPGLFPLFKSFLETHAAIEDERTTQADKRHKSNTIRLNIIMAVVALATIILAFKH